MFPVRHFQYLNAAKSLVCKCRISQMCGLFVDLPAETFGSQGFDREVTLMKTKFGKTV